MCKLHNHVRIVWYFDEIEHGRIVYKENQVKRIKDKIEALKDRGFNVTVTNLGW